jgi:endonuclease/exonuclease/phosphatase family metal-dependent hydrolase
MDTTRDVLFVTLQYQDVIMNVFVVHLPSQREAINAPKRDHILQDIRKRINSIIEDDDEAVIICGDFNENPTDDNIRSFRKSDAGNPLLNQPFYELFQQRNFSTYHKKDGLLFDQVLFSNHFIQENATLKFQSAKVFKSDKISEWDKKYKGRPFRTYAGTRYLGGYSDHFPVLVEFNNSKK